MSRKRKNILFHIISWIAVLLSASILVFIVGVILWNGIGAINLDFIFTSSRNFGAEGGIFYQILGSLLIVIVSALISFPLALGTAIYKSEFLQNKFLKKLSDVLIYSLNAIPSIIYGVFGLIFFVNMLHTGISWFVGSIILSFMILPTIVLSTYQSVNSIPQIYRESAMALSLTKWEVILKVILPQGIEGAVSGLFIGIARAIGETAPIMFIATAFSGVDVPGSLFEPVVTLPTHILALAQQATNQNALQNAWGASLVLLFLVMMFSVSALFSRLKFKVIK